MPHNKGKLANNTKLSMRAYGLVGGKDTTLTRVGRALHDRRHDEPALYEAFGRHVLKNCHGMNFVQCVLDMQAAREPIDLIRLRRWLDERGISVPRGGKHMSTLRLWLEAAGVFVSGYRVDQDRLNEVLGLDLEEFDVLASFTPEQRAYLKTLANMGGGGPHLSNDVERLASVTYGISFNEKNLPKQVLYPLRDASWIELERGTRQKGRGAKPFQVKAAGRLVTDLITPMIEQLEHQSQSDLRPMLRKSLKEIRGELGSSERHIRGLALEALAFKLMRLVDLAYVATRLRGSATGGAEVDLVFQSARLVFSRWQVQCKNTDSGIARRCRQGSRPYPLSQEQRDRHGHHRRNRGRSPPLREQDHGGLEPVHHHGRRRRPCPYRDCVHRQWSSTYSTAKPGTPWNSRSLEL